MLTTQTFRTFFRSETVSVNEGIAVKDITLNDRLDYFGQKVNIASRVQGLADAGEIYISEDVYTFPGIQEAVADYRVRPEQVIVKGVSEKLQVYRISMFNLLEGSEAT